MSAAICIAHKDQYGTALRCTRPFKHKGRHRWAKDDNLYLFGRLDPDNVLDQAFVQAWNRGAARSPSEGKS